MRYRRWLVVASLAVIPYAQASERGLVVVPLTDVWSTPQVSTTSLTDDLRQTQLLFGEAVMIRSSSGPWSEVEIPDQMAFRPNGHWQGYPGWVLTNTLVRTPSPRGSRAAILEVARGFIGAPYLWGGLSATGADCSGLVHLAYRLNGITLPRDSYEQWMKARPIRRSQLKPADLIFSAQTSAPKKISHVALYAGGTRLLEAPQNGIRVREIEFKEKYGQDLSTIESGDTVGKHIVFFGRYLDR